MTLSRTLTRSCLAAFVAISLGSVAATAFAQENVASAVQPVPSSVLEQKVRTFFDQFFNKGVETAFDDFTGPGYLHNGKPSDGVQLKKYLRELRKPSSLQVEVTEILVDDGNDPDPRVAVSWTARFHTIGPDGKWDTSVWKTHHGMNVFIFKDGRVWSNYSVRQGVTAR